mmetsp:Transcript_20521/g.61184  ORF Transcript_20521/g.61184 Transcript_20521/m.61184 type:complete len:689 (+) Transcript_20521:1137-3203(+)
MLAGIVEASRAAPVALGHPRGDLTEVADGVVTILHLVREGQAAPLPVEDATGVVVVPEVLLLPHVREPGADHVRDVRQARRAREVEGVAGAVVLDLVEEHANGTPVAQRQQRDALQRRQLALEAQRDGAKRRHLDAGLNAVRGDDSGAEGCAGVVLVDALGDLPRGFPELRPHGMDVVLAVRLVDDADHPRVLVEEDRQGSSLEEWLDVLEHLLGQTQRGVAVGGEVGLRGKPAGRAQAHRAHVLRLLRDRSDVDALLDRPGCLAASLLEAGLELAPAHAQGVLVVRLVAHHQAAVGALIPRLKAVAILEDDLLLVRVPDLGLQDGLHLGRVEDGEVYGLEHLPVALRVRVRLRVREVGLPRKVGTVDAEAAEPVEHGHPGVLHGVLRVAHDGSLVLHKLRVRVRAADDRQGADVPDLLDEGVQRLQHVPADVHAVPVRAGHRAFQLQAERQHHYRGLEGRDVLVEAFQHLRGVVLGLRHVIVAVAPLLVKALAQLRSPAVESPDACPSGDAVARDDNAQRAGRGRAREGARALQAGARRKSEGPPHDVSEVPVVHDDLIRTGLRRDSPILAIGLPLGLPALREADVLVLHLQRCLEGDRLGAPDRVVLRCGRQRNAFVLRVPVAELVARSDQNQAVAEGRLRAHAERDGAPRPGGRGGHRPSGRSRRWRRPDHDRPRRGGRAQWKLC